MPIKSKVEQSNYSWPKNTYEDKPENEIHKEADQTEEKHHRSIHRLLSAAIAEGQLLREGTVPHRHPPAWWIPRETDRPENL